MSSFQLVVVMFRDLQIFQLLKICNGTFIKEQSRFIWKIADVSYHDRLHLDNSKIEI